MPWPLRAEGLFYASVRFQPVADSDCRFVLMNVREEEIRQDVGYHVFEPTVEIELNGVKVFESLGASGAEPVVIMHFREDALAETCRLVANYDRHPAGEDEYDYWFHGTGCGLKLRRKGTQLHIAVDVDWGMGPADKVAPGIYPVGWITVRAWVEAIVVLSNDLSKQFRRLNPELFAYIKDQELLIQELESWLISQDS